MKKAKIITEQDLIDMPVPGRTDTYRPVPNKLVIERIRKNIDKMNLEVDSKKFIMTDRCGQSIGIYNFKCEGDMGMQLVFRNSYDRSRSFAVVGGSVVFVCTNGMISASEDSDMYRHKHNGDISECFEEMIDIVFDRMVMNHGANVRARSVLAGIYVTEDVLARIVGIIHMARIIGTRSDEIMNSVQYNRFCYEMKHSKSFKIIDEYNNVNSMSMWDLYNHGTEALKDCHPSCYIEKHVMWHKLVFDIAKLLYPYIE